MSVRRKTTQRQQQKKEEKTGKLKTNNIESAIYSATMRVSRRFELGWRERETEK